MLAGEAIPRLTPRATTERAPNFNLDYSPRIGKSPRDGGLFPLLPFAAVLVWSSLMKTRVVPLLVLASLLASAVTLRAASANQVKVTRADDRVRVEIGGQLFTEYIFKGATKPYLYPVLAADGTPMTRDYPMKKGVPGDVEDHVHHRSLFFTHGNVNGLDFWAEPGGQKQGRIIVDSVEQSVKKGAAEIVSHNSWKGPDDTVHLTDDTIIRIRPTADGRIVDFEVTLKAPKDKPVKFGDTKEGSMAIRLPLWMTPSHKIKGAKHVGTGTIINAQGVKDTDSTDKKDDDTWGKRSEWVDYYARKDGKTYGVAMFDHPKNPRHPTWWHVRSYALFAANPFGKHDFERLKDQPNAGDFVIPAGGTATFRWRLYFHMGDEKTAKIAERYKEYAAGK